MTVFRFAVVTLLIASAVNLSLMAPGGFVETRDFSAYPAIVLGAFNVLLTVLGLGSLVLAVIVARKGRGVWPVGACRSRFCLRLSTRSRPYFSGNAEPYVASADHTRMARHRPRRGAGAGGDHAFPVRRIERGNVEPTIDSWASADRSCHRGGDHCRLRDPVCDGSIGHDATSAMNYASALAGTGG